MTDTIYIQPLTMGSPPQAVDGDAVRLAGGLVYAREFALMVRRDTKVVHREIVTGRAMARALAALPDALAAEGEAQWANLQLSHPPLVCGDRTIRLDQPQIMGILNVTPDSFSDGGKFIDNPAAAAVHAAAMHQAGAAIIDVGGESTRPGAAAVWEGDEIARVVPAIERCVAMGAAVSIDTRRAAVMEAALAAGARMVNDVSALRYDPRSLAVVAAGVGPVVLMHAPGSGEDLHGGERSANVLLDVFDWLRTACERTVAGGVARERIILDPGIGFGKSLADNLALLNGLALFHALGRPLLLGASRKRLIGALSNEADAHRRLGGSLVLALAGMRAGVQILRVHDVFETVQARDVWRGLADAGLADFALLAKA